MSKPEQYSKPELFFGLVGAIGTDLAKVAAVLSKALASVGYTTKTIRLSELLRGLKKYRDLPTKYADDYIDTHMSAGDAFGLSLKDRMQWRFSEWAKS